jgi:hypothetical protein
VSNKIRSARRIADLPLSSEYGKALKKKSPNRAISIKILTAAEDSFYRAYSLIIPGFQKLEISCFVSRFFLNPKVN